METFFYFLDVIKRLSEEKMSVNKIAKEFSVTQRTAYRLVTVLEESGFGVERDIYGKYRITMFPEQLEEFLSSANGELLSREAS